MEHFDYFCSLVGEWFSLLNNSLSFSAFGSAIDYARLNWIYDSSSFEECRKYYLSRQAKQRRLFKRISKYFNRGFAFFVTLTFDDYYLQSLSFASKREAVTSFFRGLNAFYIANVDYGEKNNRIHYHAFIVLENIPDNVNIKKIKNRLFYNIPGWRFGFSSFAIINGYDSDIKRISKYINKLTNHAVKDTADKIIYCRKVPSWAKVLDYEK